MKSFFLLLFISCSVMWSCKETNPRTIKEWVSMSDTMYQRLVNEEQPKLDSLCIQRSDSLYRIAYDSIFEKRMIEIRLLLDSNKINVYGR